MGQKVTLEKKVGKSVAKEREGEKSCCCFFKEKKGKRQNLAKERQTDRQTEKERKVGAGEVLYTIGGGGGGGSDA